MIGYVPVTSFSRRSLGVAAPPFSFKRAMGQEVRQPPAPVLMEYKGFPGILETMAVLSILGAGTWIGIRTGLQKNQKDLTRGAGWVAGVGSALLALMYLGAKTGVGQEVGVPGVSVYPS